ncbi:MAG: hypothetical protein FWG48_06840 [Oscillospiraceae bacterium]|nr:hypothetical protein [Oscillospiraceae bacterium]
MPRKKIEEPEVGQDETQIGIDGESALPPDEPTVPDYADAPPEPAEAGGIETVPTAKKRQTRKQIGEADASQPEATGMQAGSGVADTPEQSPEPPETQGDSETAPEPSSGSGTDDAPDDDYAAHHSYGVPQEPAEENTQDSSAEDSAASAPLSAGPVIADDAPDSAPDDAEPDSSTAPVEPDPEESAAPVEEKPKPPRSRKKTIYDLDLNSLDRYLTPEEQQEWSSIYASYRSKSILTGTVIGADEHRFDVRNRETGEIESKSLVSLIIIGLRVKVLIPESEMWMPGEERPGYVLRNMTGSTIDYVIVEVDREGQCAIGSRRIALAAKRHFFATARGGHPEGELLKCRVLIAGPHRCTIEAGGYDIRLTQRELSYTTVPDLRERFHPGQELSCRLKSYDRNAGKLLVSVKEASPNPFIGADARHPVGSRRQAVISGKYAGGVFCTLPDGTVCLCLYSARHSDIDFAIGDKTIILIRSFNYEKQLVYGRILSKW